MSGRLFPEPVGINPFCQDRLVRSVSLQANVDRQIDLNKAQTGGRFACRIRGDLVSGNNLRPEVSNRTSQVDAEEVERRDASPSTTQAYLCAVDGIRAIFQAPPHICSPMESSIPTCVIYIQDAEAMVKKKR